MYYINKETRKYMKIQIKKNIKKVLRLFKENLIAFFSCSNYIVAKKDKIAFVLFAADYNNIGDIAITYCQKQFLEKELGKEYEIICIYPDDIYKAYRSMKKIINQTTTIITLIGGGNTGNIYSFIDDKRLFVLKKFKKEKIVSFPQSLRISNDYDGKKWKNEFKQSFLKCKNIKYFFRESTSFENFCEHVTNKNVYLVPDIVFSLGIKPIVERGNMLGLILRNDIEKIVKQDTINFLLNEVSNFFDSQVSIDTCDVMVNGNGFSQLFEYIEKLKKCEVVITDRLHGMILCYVLKIPCLVFNNNNNKIKSTYDTWISDCNYIMYMDDNSVVDAVIAVKKLKKITDFNKKTFSKEYNHLIKALVE